MKDKTIGFDPSYYGLLWFINTKSDLSKS